MSSAACAQAAPAKLPDELPPFGADGHELIRAPEAVPIWAPLVERFLASVR